MIPKVHILIVSHIVLIFTYKVPSFYARTQYLRPVPALTIELLVVHPKLHRTRIGWSPARFINIIIPSKACATEYKFPSSDDQTIERQKGLSPDIPIRSCVTGSLSQLAQRNGRDRTDGTYLQFLDSNLLQLDDHFDNSITLKALSSYCLPCRCHIHSRIFHPHDS